MLTQRHLQPPLTSTVKLSLFMLVHSSTLSLAARSYRCHANRSCYINNGWTFFGQTHVGHARTAPTGFQCPLVAYVSKTDL